MTEREWLTTREVGDMESLLFDTNRFSKRKMRLVSIEACKHIVHLLPLARYGPVIEWAEQYSDGLTDQQAFRSLSGHLSTTTGEPCPAAAGAATRAVLSLGPDDAPDAATLQVVDAKGIEAMATTGCISPTLSYAEVGRLIEDARGSATHDVFTRACEAEELAIADLVREIFGNPFHPITIDPAWLARNDAAIPRIARSVYEERAFHRMPALADALLDAGCEHEELIAHCRSAGPHVRGCWAVDLILGKE
jgi:hypothetical protein